MWKFNNPVEIVFGEGSLSTLSHKLNNRTYAIVTYDNPYFEQLTKEIQKQHSGCVTVFNQVSENPDLADLPAICDAFQEHHNDIDVLVALGGGSVIDTTKALAVAQGSSDVVIRVVKDNEPVEHALPIIAIPTTTGTGSEVTSWATIWDKASNTKYSLDLPVLFPESAICDPNLTLELPVSLTIQTGLDALSHALESIWNNNANPVSLMYATKAISIIINVLPKLARKPNNLSLRNQMMTGSLYAGLAFSNTKTSIAHNMSYAITLDKNLPHGIACSFTLPAVLCSFNFSACDTAQRLRAIFGQDLNAAAEDLEQWFNQLDIATKPESYGYTKNQWQTLLNAALNGERGKNFSGDAHQLINQFM